MSNCKSSEGNLKALWHRHDCDTCPQGPCRSSRCLLSIRLLEGDPGRPDYSEQGITKAVALVWLAVGRPPVRGDFAGHKGRGRVPSYTTVRKYLGSLATARRLALALLVSAELLDYVETELPRRGRRRVF